MKNKKKVVILAPSGAGKTTDSITIGEYLGVDVIHLDYIVNSITNEMYEKWLESNKNKSKKDFKNAFCKYDRDGYKNLKLDLMVKAIEDAPKDSIVDMPGDMLVCLNPRLLQALKDRGTLIVYKNVSNDEIIKRLDTYFSSKKIANEKDRQNVKNNKGSLYPYWIKEDLEGVFYELKKQMDGYRKQVPSAQKYIDLNISEEIGNNLSGIELYEYILQNSK